jgi:hypothetical protein
MSHHAAARKAKNGSPKIWKLSPIDYAAMARWDDYTRARDEMFAATDRPPAPWTVVLSNDKRRAPQPHPPRLVDDRLCWQGRAYIARQPDALILCGIELIGK